MMLPYKAKDLRVAYLIGRYNIDTSINEWLEDNADVEIVDIKFNSCDDCGLQNSVLIIYRELDSDERTD